MNRRKFVLSWGRKMFFGFSWPLTSVLALFYLQSALLPDSFLSGLYYAFSYIGFFGGLNLIAYFFFFAPVVLLFPSYYVSRIWSLLIILALNAWILMDVGVFIQYRMHLNSFIIQLLINQGPQIIFGQSALTIFLIGGVALIGGFWFRGNIIWRWMQKRFSNPVDNWYLVVIVLCLGISQFIEFRSGGNLSNLSRMKYLFPWRQEISLASLGSSSKNFGYPKKELKCTSKENKNFFLFVLNGVGKNQMTAEFMPNVYHLAQHGTSFENHLATSASEQDSTFSLLYGIPSTYRMSFDKKEISPLLIQEMEKRKYKIHHMSLSTPEFVNQSLNSFEGTPVGMMFDLLPGSPTNQDLLVKGVIEELHKRNLLENAYIAFTSTHGPEVGSYLRENLHVPFILVKPARLPGQISHVTTHYDVAPTLMRDLWNCKGTFQAVSSGEALEEEKKDHWVVLGDQEKFLIYDFKDNIYAQLDSYGHPVVRNSSYQPISSENKTDKFLLKGLKEIIRFYKP